MDDLNKAVRIGGANSLTERIEMVPAGGTESIIAPAKYTDGNAATYVIETRYIDGAAKKTALIDSKTSHANRLEKTITDAMKDNEGLLSLMPRICVSYQTDAGEKRFFDNELPHRAFDGHIRVGTHDGQPTSKSEAYIAARNSTLDNLMPMFDLSPDTVAFGGWDSTRSRNQLRIPSVFSGEIVGVLAEQGDGDPVVHRAGARVDPVEPSVVVDNKKDREKITADADLSKNTKDKFEREGKGSSIGLGAIPPSASKDVLDGVAVSRVLCIHVLSFATLRSFRFGKGKDGDAAIRALIAAVILRSMVGFNADPVLRANCFLNEKEAPVFILNGRFGEDDVELEPLTIETAEALLRTAYDQAHVVAGIDWQRQVFEVVGNPEVLRNSSAAEE
ncbi:type I-U CRISPR-associated RAMP protein Csb1/Cas7u [Bifidobacterium phasiani]|uniref:type I-G CRISPR-associated RAMP protein Csb1/Cas7g n=1 Tax=Bifidobacterium phasiani TaxID=2834431 RepID=UPI001F18662B|nr:type I-U CRISPR-associated RAMP protein Csb1/Cas7u [Bifidobacterium phasiani]